MFFAFGIADFLQHHLFSSLRGDAAEIDRRQQVFNFATDFQRLIQLFRGFQANLRVVVKLKIRLAAFFRRNVGFAFGIIIGNNRAHAIEFDFAAFTVDLGADIVLMPIFAAAGGLDRLLHGFDHRIFRQAFFACDRVGDLQQFRASVNSLCGAHNNLLFLLFQ